ncbi:MAG TPA: cache domain-containing protein [Streptosporangiaceae bacterium]|jgi:hypothetical protein
MTRSAATAGPAAQRAAVTAGRAAGDLRAECARLLAEVSDQIEQVLASVDRIGQATSAAAVAARRDGRLLQRADLAAVRPLAAELLDRHPALTAGAGVVLAPGALADVPRWIEWWRSVQGPGPEQLQVDLDPESAEFYDYTMTEWYRGPQRTGGPSVAGPYVDYICTHQYTFTLSAPVWCAGEFTGVAGCDILAGQIERLVEPGLSRLGRPAVLVSGSGRVIASNLPAVLPGTAARRQPACAGLIPVTVPAGQTEPESGPGVLPWTILSHLA